MKAMLPATRWLTGRRQLSTFANAAIVVSIVVLTGCGGGSTDSYAKITGTVTVNGKPIKEGKVLYFPGTSRAAGGGSAKIVDGSYSLTKVPLGDVVFTFSASAETGKTVPGPGGVPEPERINIIPAKIASEGITRQITGSGTQNFSIE